MFGLVLINAIWTYWINSKGVYAMLLVLRAISFSSIIGSIVEMLLVLVSFIDIILVDVLLSFLNWFLFLMICGCSTRYSNRLHDFVVTVPHYSKEIYANSFFPRTAKLWNSLPGECFPLTHNLYRFKANVNRHLKSLS